MTTPTQAAGAATVTRESLRIGSKYNWKNQPERLVYVGSQSYRYNGVWYQFALVTNPDRVWCEVHASDLSDLEETQEAASTATAPSAPTGWKLIPIEPTSAMISAMSCSKARDDEGEFPALLDLIDYSGENKTHAVLRAAYAAMLKAAPSAPDSAAPSSLSAEPGFTPPPIPKSERGMTEREISILDTCVANMDDLDDKDWRDHGFRLATFKSMKSKLSELTLQVASSTPPAPAAAIPAPDALQELHGLLYLAQRTTGDAQAEAIGKARLLLSRLRDAPKAEPDLTEDGAIWKAIIAWADARNSAFAVSGAHAAAVDGAIRASTPFAYWVYVPAEQRGELVHDLDEATDDLTNCKCEITELFDHPAPAAAIPAVSAEPDGWKWEELTRWDNDPDYVWRTMVDEDHPGACETRRNIRPLYDRATPSPAVSVEPVAWINIYERQPEEGNTVVCHAGFTPYLAYLIWGKDAAGEWVQTWSHDGEPEEQPTHWMPLPPYPSPDLAQPQPGTGSGS